MNTKDNKEILCVHGTGRWWDGVLISTHTTFRQLDFRQSLIPKTDQSGVKKVKSGQFPDETVFRILSVAASFSNLSISLG